MAGKSKTKGEESTELNAGLTFVAIIFLIRGLYLLVDFFGSISWGRSPEVFEVLLFGGINIIPASFYFLVAVGIIYRRPFALYLGYVIVLLDVLANVVYVFTQPMFISGLVVGILMIYLLHINEHNFRKFDKTDSMLFVGIVLLIFLYLVALVWAYHLPDAEERAAIVTKEAIEKGDVGVCEKLNFDKNNCIKSIAISTKNLSMCDEISNTHIKEQCYRSFAVSLRREDLCEKITDIYKKDSCYLGLAKCEKNMTYCEEIQANHTEEFCINYVNEPLLPKEC
ncbi:MAG: hypothetical protein MSIBF_03280 [Candidatus Altiarchaeales archaeon IMC4]|nr:MAG: hypothetical protein MSIBF_03280 [Candidatus Altiarchaeales archaeon IMC4]